MPISRFFKTALPIFLFFLVKTASAQIWLENFSGANQGWTDNFTDCDGTGTAMVVNGRFEVNDMEGDPCCAVGGGNNNEWVTNEINIQNFCNVGISAQYGFVGTFECSAGGPYLGPCTNDPAIDNGHDQILFQYSLDGGPWVQFAYVCGGQAGTATIGGLSGNTIRVRIMPANKSTAEVYWFDNVTVTGTTPPTVNPPADVTACAGANVPVNFSGTGSPTFNWTNNNTAIGLGASGMGNLNFPAAAVTTPTTATITVTPSAAGCTGQPETFDITINPVPTVNQPPNISVCSGDMVEIMFDGSSPTATYNWTVNIPFLPPSGSGNITGTVPTVPFPVSGTVTVTPTENGCNGQPKSFTVSAFPAPSAVMNMTNGPNFCAGQNANFSIAFSGGTGPYTVVYALNGANQAPVTTNSNPYNFSITVNADVTVSGATVTTGVGCTVPINGSFDVEVTPTPVATLAGGTAAICDGQMVDLDVSFNGSDNYTFVYSQNNINQPSMSATGPAHSFTVEPPTGTTTYRLVSVSSSGCTGTATGTFTITNSPTPTATLNGSPVVCAGQNAPVAVNLTGTAPYTFTYSLNGEPQPAVTTSSTSYTIQGQYSTTTLIEIESITSGTCTGSAGGSTTVTVTPAPQANLVPGNTAICNGQSVPLNVNFFGAAPYTFVHAVNGVNQAPIVTIANPYALTVSPTSGTTTYTLVSVSSNGCTGTAAGTHSVTVGAPPSVALSGDADICSGQNASLNFNFTGPIPPYTVQYTANSVAQTPLNATANPFVFPVNPTETTLYEITAVSAGTCTGTFSGSALVVVNPSSSATLEAGNDTICSGTKDTLDVKFGGSPGPYTFVYGLNGVPVDTITTNDTIYKLPLMPPVGRDTFSLLSITSPTCPGGAVSGTHIYWVKPTPHTDLSGDFSVCAGNIGNLVFNFTGDTVWTANYTANGAPQPPLITTKDPDTLQVSPVVSTTYILTDVVSSNGCSSTVPDTVVMAVNPGASASIDSVEVAFCAGASDTTIVTLGGGAPYTLVYSINGVPQPPVITNGPTYQIIQMPPAGASDTLRLVSVSSPGCTGSTVSGQRIVRVKPVPTANFVGSGTTICGAGNVQVVVDFTGGGLWELNYTLDGLAQFPLTTVKDPDTISFFASANTTLEIISVSADGCVNTTADQYTVTVADSLTAVLSGGGQVCQNGNGADLIVTFDGQGPYTYTYEYFEMGMPVQVTTTTTDNPHIFRLNPTNGKVYNLVSVSNGICTGQASGTAVIFVFTPPTAELKGGGIFCDSADTNISVDFTGTGPFAITYTANGVTVGPDTTFEDPYLIPVNVKTTTTYEIKTVQSPGCVGTVSGSATLTVNYSISTSNLSRTCDPVAGEYTISFNTTGVPPFTLLSGAGTFTGNTFVSNPIPAGTPYNFEFRDASNCNTATVSGLEDCSCESEAGMMSASPELVCQDQQVSVPTATGFILDSNDTLMYVLHTNPGLPFGTIFAINNLPTFTLQPGMVLDSMYYVSAVVGDKLANGLVDTTDLCLSVAIGTPVIFHKIPAGELIALDTAICPGEAIELTIAFNGIAEFSFRLDSAGTLLPPVKTIPTDTFQFFVNPFTSTLYVLDSIGDNFCPNGLVKGSVNINVFGPPTLKNDTIICDYTSNTYTVKFTVANGVPPFNVLGGLTGTFMDTLFESDPIPWGQPYFGLLEDALQCGTDTVQGSGDCSCVTNAGTLVASAPISLCASDSATVVHSGNFVLDGNDVLAFILHDRADTTLGSVLAASLVPKFGFDPNTMTLGTTYYISPIAGNFDGIGGVDTTDFCLDVTAGISVVWNPGPTAAMSDTFDVCPGEQLFIPIALTGVAPFMLTYTNNGNPVNVTAFSNNFAILATLQDSAIYIPVSVKDANCPGTVSGQAIINVHQAPEIVNVKVTCSPDNLNYVLEFDVTKVELVAGSVSVTGNVTGTYNETTGHFTSNPIPRTLAYAMSVVDLLFNCGQDQISGVSNCGCPTMAGTMQQTPLTLCVGDPANTLPVTGSVLETNDTLVYALISGNPANPSSWTVLATNTAPQFAYNATTMVPGTTYLIVAVAGNSIPNTPGVDLSDPCLSVTPGPTVVWRVPPTASITGNPSICPGDQATLTITFTGTGPFNYTYTAGGGAPQSGTSATNTATITVSPSANTTYALTTVSGSAGCTGTVSGSASVTIRTLPTATLNGNFTLCAGENINFPINFTGSAPFKFVYAINGTPQPQLSAPTSTFFISSNNLQGPQTFTLVSVEDANCPGTTSGTVNISVNQPPTAGLTTDVTLCAGDSTDLTLALTGANAFDVTISGGLQPIQLSGVSNGTKVNVKPAATTTYFVSAVTPTGNTCTPTVTTDATVTVTSLSATATVSNYGGFGVSCPGQQDGSITLNPVGGTPPFTAVWTPAATGLQISNLDTGTYSVLLTDLTGCRFLDTFQLTSPTGITLAFDTKPPLCFGQTDGSLSITGITGGAEPYSLTINGTPAILGPSLPAVYGPIPPGDYKLVLSDANGCETEETAIVAMPPALMLELGNDLTISLGDSALLSFFTNALVLDTFLWSPTATLRTPNKRETWAMPTESQQYTVIIRDTLGCTAEDRVTVNVSNDNRIYVPNVIKPSSATFNDFVTVFAGAEVKQVIYFRIYDRWGSQVFENENFAPNDERRGWNGRDKGQDVNPGVFIYVAEVEYFNGKRTVVSGDVTVVR